MPESFKRLAIASKLSKALASMSFTAEHCNNTCSKAGRAATSALMRSSTPRALAKNMLASTRRQTNLGLTNTSWRVTLRKCSVPGTKPTVAMWGRLARNKNSASDTSTPKTKPLSTPTSKVASKVVATAMKSSLEKRQVDFNIPKSTSDNTATMMVAARVACGR